MNETLIARPVKRKNITVLLIPASDIASEIGDSKVANMVILGAYIAYTRFVAKESIIKGLEYLLEEDNRRLFEYAGF